MVDPGIRWAGAKSSILGMNTLGYGRVSWSAEKARDPRIVSAQPLAGSSWAQSPKKSFQGQGSQHMR